MKEHTHPNALERYSFWWSEARLVIAAIALFLGGIPPIRLITPSVLYGLMGTILNLCWIISGVVAAYLLYRWIKNGMSIFGGKNSADVVAFLIAVVTGLNLGIAGVSASNIGMSITTNRFILFVVGLVYLWSAWQLYRRFNASGKKLF